MRYIVFTLILANAIYFGWRFLSPEPVAPNTNATHIDKSQIELIDESSESIESPESTTAQTAPVDSTHDANELDIENASATETSDKTHTTEMDASSTAASEIGKPESPPTELVVAPAPIQCVMTPWTRDEKQLKQWRDQIQDAAVETLTQEVETQRRFLVYIPAKATTEKTLERLREIKKLPIESAHINKGEFIGGISLGLFSQLESAETVLKEAHNLGINDAKQTVRILTATEYRLRRQSSDAPAAPWGLCTAD